MGISDIQIYPKLELVIQISSISVWTYPSNAAECCFSFHAAGFTFSLDKTTISFYFLPSTDCGGLLAEIFLKNRDVIIISNQSYEDRYWTSKQYITRELVKTNRVLYVDGNYSFGKLFLGMMGKKWPVTLLGKLRREEENLWVYTPPPRLPWRNNFKFFSNLNQILLRNGILLQQRKLQMERPIFWSFLHATSLLRGKFNEAIFIYHCVDDWSQLLPLAKMGRSRQINRDEQKMATNADLCFCTAEFLQEKLKPYNTNTRYTPNAASLELFNLALKKETRIPLDVAALQRPVIGFVGNFEKKVDPNLLYDMFFEKKEWTFVSLGMTGSGNRIDRLGALPNVHLLGLKPKESLPGYLKKIDVAIIPFYIGELGKSISPLKLFEYFAAGKPVVSANLPEIARFHKYVWLAETKNDYITGIEEALKKKDDPDYLKELGALARKHSWPERIIEYNKAIEKTVEGKKE